MLPYPAPKRNQTYKFQKGREKNPFHNGFERRTMHVMDFSTLIPGNALTKLKSLPLSDNALSDVITYTTLKGIKLPRIELLSMGHANIQTPIQTQPLQ
jgi:hypothetical protein